MTPEQLEAAREMRRKYKREWYAANKEKARGYQMAHYLRKARQEGLVDE